MYHVTTDRACRACKSDYGLLFPRPAHAFCARAAAPPRSRPALDEEAVARKPYHGWLGDLGAPYRTLSIYHLAEILRRRSRARFTQSQLIFFSIYHLAEILLRRSTARISLVSTYPLLNLSSSRAATLQDWTLIAWLAMLLGSLCCSACRICKKCPLSYLKQHQILTLFLLQWKDLAGHFKNQNKSLFTFFSHQH